MSRFMDKFAVTQIVIPFPGKIAAGFYEKLPREHFIDRLVWDKLKQLNLTPSEPAAKRPSAAGLSRRHRQAAVAGRDPGLSRRRSRDKRAEADRRLLDRPEYADFWANKWADLLRPNPYHVGIKAVFNLDAFLRDSFRAEQAVRPVCPGNC